jgi:hypothetical protein
MCSVRAMAMNSATSTLRSRDSIRWTQFDGTPSFSASWRWDNSASRRALAIAEAMTRRRLANFTRSALGLGTKVIQLPYQGQWYEIRTSGSILVGSPPKSCDAGRCTENPFRRVLAC